MKHKLILLALVFSLVIVSQDSQSLGMGKIQVNSALDEPLNATINIMANENEPIDQVSVVLATSADYKKVGLDKSFVPSNILVSVDEANPYQINVTSNGPVSEPIVSILLDVTWPNGRILREFTLLLDPPTYQASSSGSIEMPPVTESEPVTTTESYVADETVASEAEAAQSDEIPPVSTDLNQMQEAMAEAEVTAEPTLDTPIAASSPVRQSQNVGEVQVNAGDTLWRIANQNRAADVTTHQMMMAIYEINPQAFHNNNINQMLKDSILTMPSIDQVQAISYNEALAEVKAQNDSWAAEHDNYSSYQTEAKDTVSKVVADTPDYGVQLSGGDGNEADSQQTEGEEAVAGSSEMDAVDTYNVSSENQELKSRVSELESIVGEQQAALQLEDDSLANLEKQLAEVDNEDSLSDGGFDQAGSDETTADDNSLDQALADDELGDDVWDNADTLTEDGAYTGDDTEAFVEDLSGADASSDETTITPAEPVKTVMPANQPWYSQAMDWLMNNILWVIIGLVVLLVLVLLPKLLNRTEEVADEGSFLDDIKSSRRTEIDDPEETDDFIAEDDETVMTKTLSANELDTESEEDDFDFDTLSDEDASSDDDVLADLDSSLKFGEDRANVENDEDVFDFDFDDEDEADEVKASEVKADASIDTDDSYVDGTPTKEYDPRPFMALDDVTEDDDKDDEEIEFSLDDLADLDVTDNELEVDIEEDVEDDFDDTFDLEAELEELQEVPTDAPKLSSTDEHSLFDEDEFLSELDDLDTLDDDDSLEDVLTTKTTVDDESKEGAFDDILSLDDQDEEETAAFDADEDDEMNESIDLGLDDLMGEGDVIETKMDLAKAYIEMGDTVGAKNLLAEVISEGNSEQVNTAKKLLDEM